MNVIIPQEFKYYNSNMEVITEPTENEIGFIPELNKTYQYTNGEWKEVALNTDLQLTMYDLNKQVISQLPTLGEDELTQAWLTIDNYVQACSAKYFMLLCNDIRYYTVFALLGTGEQCATEVLDCISNLGALKSVGLTEDEAAIEIWFQPEGEQPFAAYFFNYEGGVIECQK